MDPITALTRPAAGTPEGVLVLIHGRGSNEHDLFGLFDMVDPGRRLVGITPRGPLALPPGGRHWYAFRALGYPDPATFLPTYDAAGAWLDTTVEELGLTYDRVVIGGFSQGCVMSWALGLGAGRPRPAGIVGMSGFMPTVDGFELEFDGLEGFPAAISHGTLDSVIGVEWGRQARDRMADAGADVTYHESAVPHTLDPAFIPVVERWLGEVI